MANEPLNDFVTMTQALGGFTESLGQLYNMNVKVQSDKYALELGQADTDFIMRMNKPFGDPDRIDKNNFTTALQEYQDRMSNQIGIIKDEGVRGAVDRNFRESRNSFILKASEHFTAQYVADTQADYANNYNTVRGMDVPDDRLEEKGNQLVAMAAEARRLGLFDGERQVALENDANNYRAASILVRDSLAKAGGKIYDAYPEVATGSTSDQERAEAQKILDTRAASVEKSWQTRMDQLEPYIKTGQVSDADLDYFNKNINGRADFVQKLRDRMTAAIVSADTTDGIVFTDHVVADPNRTYSSVWIGKDEFVKGIDQARSANDEKYRKDMVTQINRYDAALDDLKPKKEDEAKDAEINWNITKMKWDRGAVPGSALVVALMRLGTKGSARFEAARKELIDGSVYGTNELNRAIDTAQTVKDSLLAAIRNSQNSIPGVTEKDLLAKGSSDKLDMVISEITERQMAFAMTGDKKTDAQLKENLLKLEIPMLKVWSSINRNPTKELFGDPKVFQEAAEAIDSGALDELYKTTDIFSGKPYQSRLLSASKAIYASRAKSYMDEALAEKGSVLGSSTYKAADGSTKNLTLSDLAVQVTPAGDVKWISPKIPGRWWEANMLSANPDGSGKKRLVIQQFDTSLTAPGGFVVSGQYEPSEVAQKKAKAASDAAAMQMWTTGVGL
jgi:hypothetical protein